MAEILKVAAVIVLSSLVLLGSATLIQLIEQMLHEPRPGA